MRGGQYLIFHRYIKIRIPDDVSIAGGRDSGYKTDVDFYNSEEDEWTTVHNWPRCPEGDIRPEAILSRAFGTSRTASHRSVTLYKGPESSDVDSWLDSTPF